MFIRSSRPHHGLSRKLCSAAATPRPFKLGLLSATFCLFAAQAAAQANCPWISQATASGLLGGKTTPTIKLDATGQLGTCTFTFHRPQQSIVLHIAVAPYPAAPSPLSQLATACTSSTSAVPAIGNEALACHSNHPGSIGELMIGRVRDILFTLTLTSTAIQNAPLDRAALQSTLHAAAEQVTGNLF